MANHPAPLHADVVSFLPGRQDEDDALDLLGHLNELREQRISALEEVMAAPLAALAEVAAPTAEERP